MKRYEIEFVNNGRKCIVSFGIRSGAIKDFSFVEGANDGDPVFYLGAADPLFTVHVCKPTVIHILDRLLKVLGGWSSMKRGKMR